MRTSVHLSLCLLAAGASPLSTQSPLSAQTSAPEASQSDETRAIARTSAIGSALYAFDRAAWVATDALKPRLTAAQLAAIRGWVVEPQPDRTLLVTFYDGAAEGARAIFQASVLGGRVTDTRVLPRPLALTDAQRRLADAVTTARTEAVARKYAPCTPAPFNTVALPSPGGAGPIAVYLLSARVKPDEFPLGGHYRVVIRSDGKVLAARPYSVSCLNLTIPKLPAGATPVGPFVTSLLDPVPNEIHVFSSFAMRMPVIVGTRDKRMWQVMGAKITAISAKP